MLRPTATWFHEGFTQNPERFLLRLAFCALEKLEPRGLKNLRYYSLEALAFFGIPSSKIMYPPETLLPSSFRKSFAEFHSTTPQRSSKVDPLSLGPNITQGYFTGTPSRYLLFGTLAGVWDTESLEALFVPRVEPTLKGLGFWVWGFGA